MRPSLTRAFAAAIFAAVAAPTWAQVSLPERIENPEDARHCFGEPKILDTVTLSGKRTLDEGWFLKQGTFYEVNVVSVGSERLRLDGPEFLRAIYPAEIQVDDELLALGPFGVQALDFPDARAVRFGFIPTEPGVYRLAARNGAVTVVVK